MSEEGFPVLMINGNHDKANNHHLINNTYSNPLELLENIGYISYQGREVNVNSFEVKPLIIKKDDVIIGVYCVGYMPDDKFNFYLENKSIDFEDNK